MNLVECGPRGVLSAMGEACLDSGIEAVFVPSLRKGKRELDGFIKALGTLHCLGHDVDWTVFTPGAHATLSAPTYRFSGSSYWLDVAERSASESHEKIFYGETWVPIRVGEGLNVPGFGGR